MTRWTEEQASAHQKRVKGQGVDQLVRRIEPLPRIGRSPFKNVRCKSHDGKNFASKLERDYYEQLYLCWKAGVVLWFVRQPSFDLEGGVIYRADFLVVSLTLGAPKIEVIDTKGYVKQDSLNKIKQMKDRYGIEVQLVRKVQ